MSEQSLHLSHDRVVLHRARCRDHHVGPAIVACEICSKPRTIERSHSCGRPENGTADRLTSKGSLLQPVPNQIVRRVLGGADLLHDDVLLAPEFFRIKRRISQDVGQHVKREWHVGSQNTCVVGGRLDRGPGIEIAANRFDLLGDLTRRTPGRAFEGHVLEQMRYPMLIRSLVATAGSDPDAERGCFQMRHRVRYDRKPGRKTRDFDAHAAAPSCAARLTERI